MERYREKDQLLVPALLALVVTIAIGASDEGIQYVLPNRHYDPVDILFNSLAAFMAISATLIIAWAKKKFRKNS